MELRFIVKMRALEQQTGFNRETIRFYIHEGLLPEPSRPKANVAEYSIEHVNALKQIRHLQQDPHLTLGMIKRLLHGKPTPLNADAVDFPNLGTHLAKRMEVNRRSDWTAVAELTKRNPLAKRYIEAFAKKGVITLHRKGGKNWLSANDARLVSLWLESRSVGYREDLGFHPEGIDIFIEAMDGLVPVGLDYFLSHVRGHYDEAKVLEIMAASLPGMSEMVALLFTRSVLLELKRRTTRTRRAKHAS